MASNKKNRYNLSKGRKEQLAQARQNAKDDYNRRQKEKQNKALIQQFNATHKNAPKQGKQHADEWVAGKLVRRLENRRCQDHHRPPRKRSTQGGYGETAEHDAETGQ